jgi:hypothetical protein
MSAAYGRIAQSSVARGGGNEGTSAQLRTLRDGTLISIPWIQALVFEGRVFGVHIGDITTPIAGHATIDADQPEGSVFFAAAGVSAIPISIRATMETGATTLAQAGMMCAVSNINVAAGTSTSRTASIFNFKMNSLGIATTAAAAQAYTGNGTDPLTAGNFHELARVSAVIDADAATSGIVPPNLLWTASDAIAAPLVQNIGSILLYGEAAANTLFGQIVWAEVPDTFFD